MPCVEQTYASKVQRGQAAFVHQVVKTDAPKRIGQMNEVDATDRSKKSAQLTAVSPPLEI